MKFHNKLEWMTTLKFLYMLEINTYLYAIQCKLCIFRTSNYTITQFLQTDLVVKLLAP